MTALEILTQVFYSPLPMTILERKWIRMVFFLFGTGLLAYFITQLGIERILQYAGKIRLGILWPLVISGTWYMVNSLAWGELLENRNRSVSLYRLFSIKVAGEAVNSATPVSWVGGDPMRIALLRSFFSTTDGATSVILDRTLHSFATVLLMGGAVALALFTLDLPESLRFGLIVLVGALLAALIVTIVNQHRGLLGGLIYIADRCGLKRRISEPTRIKITEIDAQIQRFYAKKRRRLVLALALHIAGRLLGVLEIYVIAMLLHTPVTFLTAYFLAMLGALINTVFVLIPGSVGVMEGAYGGLFHLLSLDPAAGIALQLIRRVRTLFWTCVGFAFISLSKHTPRTNQDISKDIVQ